MAKFNYEQPFTEIDFRAHPERYQVGVGEQGVLLVEPYKSEILPYWRFRNPEAARTSSETIYQLFLDYKAKGDFVGMDMARKFLQMGWTRARRYANHPGGRKWNKERTEVLPYALDQEKAEAAAIFYEKYRVAREDPEYIEQKAQHQALYER